MSLIADFFSLVFPRLCMACSNTLKKNEQVLCSYCLYHLPKTNFHNQEDNPVEQLFWGKTNIKAATAYYYFHKAGKVQTLIHEFKYNGSIGVGLFIGEALGRDLSEGTRFNHIDGIIPVPLHPRKLRKRGYNQSEVFAIGLSKSMNIPVENNVLYRKMFTETQTKKSRFDRWKNVSEKFDVKDFQHLRNKSVLLVDDVITTGSTLEACAEVLLKIENIKVYIAGMAFAY